MIRAFKQYLSTLKLSAVSRKLYLSDIRRFFTYLGSEPTLDQLTSASSYTSYLNTLKTEGVAPSMLKRTIASLRQLGNFVSHTYSLPNPLSTLSETPKVASDNYIKYFANYLNAEHLSSLTVKSYKSDIARYLDWSATHLPSTQIAKLLTDQNIKLYLNYLIHSGSVLPSTIERKGKSLARFGSWYKQIYASTHISDSNTNTLGCVTPGVTSTITSKPRGVHLPDRNTPISSPDQNQESVKISNYRNLFAFAILLIFVATLGIFGYRQFSQEVRLTAAYPSSPITPNRQLSFQGRLENAAGTPITSSTALTFKLWNQLTAGTELYSTGSCSITPDADGVFSTQIGSSCGTAIPSSVFTENSNIWLEVTVAAETLTPRQPIASVAYALNTETIQGFPISSTVSAIRNTVVPMNQFGEIILGEQSPRLTGVSGTFAVSAPAISLTTTPGTNGNITIAPDGTGQVNLNGNTTSTNFFSVNNAQLTTGSLITGTVANDNTGYKLLNLLSGSTPTSKFSVSNAGDLTLAGDLTMSTNTSGMILVADGTTFSPTAVTGDLTINSTGITTIGNEKITEAHLKAVNSPTDEMCLSYESTVGDFEWQTCGSGSGGSSNWRITNGALSPVNDTLDLLVGSDATASAKFSVNATNGNTAIAGSLSLGSSTNLVFNGTTSLGEQTSAVDSGAYWVGTFDEFANSNSTNVQAVLNDLDASLSTALSGASLWTDGTTYLYPTGSKTLGDSAISGTNKLTGLYLADSAPLVFGNDNDVSFSFLGDTLGSTLTGGSRIGINTTSALATLDIRSSLGTIPTASISGNTSMATLVLDQSGTGDLFTASKSGETKFVINNAGNVGIGVSDPSNRLEIGGSTSTISNSAGDITIDSASNNISFGSDSLINILNTYVAGELGVGLSDAISKFHVHGAMIGKALVTFNELGDQDIFTASASGTTRLRLTNDGSLSLGGDYLNFGLTAGTTGYGVRDNAGVMEFKSQSGSWTPMGSGGASWWNQTLGTIQPYNQTVDLLLGGTATSSAKIALININSGTPTATISGSTAGSALSLSGDGVISTSLNSTLQINPDGGNVGIGIVNPTERLEVNGYIVAQRFVDASNAAAYLDPAASTSLAIIGDIINLDGTADFTLASTSDQNIILDAGTGTVLIGATGGGKLDAGTVDPPYTINGEKFATYMAGMTGVKEETTGVIHASQYVSNIGYRATLDLAGSPEGSDLWLFSKASNLKNSLDKLVVLLASSSNTKTWYEIDPHLGKLYLYSLAPTTISYRLTAPRYDASSWQNTRDESSSSIGHVINDDADWSVSDSIASFFAPSNSPLVSPLASGSAITVNHPVIITGSSDQESLEPALLVEGELAASTISARLAVLETISADQITAKHIVADTIEANHIIGLDAKIASLSGINETEIQTITDRIKARLLDLTVEIPSAADIPIPLEATSFETETATSPADLSATALSSADIDFVTINDYLAVIGSATITTLDVTNSLYTEQIDSKTGLLALANDTLLVDSSGQVVVNGDLTVTGKILASELNLERLNVYSEDGGLVATIDASGSANLAELTTGMITIASAPTATQSALADILGIAKSNATAGESVLISPNTELIIESPYISSNSLVYLTPTTNTDNKVLFVKSKNTNSFTIAIDSPASTDISFNWWIIELKP